MRKLLNVLYITDQNAYLSLEGKTIHIKKEQENSLRFPLLNFENIVCFNYPGVSPALMRACCENDIGLSFISPGGRFLGRVSGEVRGNILLRKEQYRITFNTAKSLRIGSSFLIGKLTNNRKVLDRAIRDHALVVDCEKINQSIMKIKNLTKQALQAATLHDLLGIEGLAGKSYFSVFNELILQQNEFFFFKIRSRRPPLDNMNAILSFLYVILANETQSALESVGLDPYAGFLHQDRPGRASLALDLMEELRPVFCDRLALSLVNRKQITGKGFIKKESGAVLMDDDTRKKVIVAWQERKKVEIIHPFLKEKIPFGLIPYTQALLLARHIRGDLDAYPPFFWE